jgi:DNA polymerase III epsilon subunit-like protein
MSQVQQLVEVIRSGNFVVLDTETTGLDYRAEIVSIAVISSKGETIINTLLKPSRPIPPDATRIHGITDNDVADAPTFPDILPQLTPILTGTNVVVYNATYDRKLLHQSAEGWNVPKTDWKTLSPWHCAMQVFAEIYGDWNDWHQSYRWQRLSTACQYYKIPVVGAHGALADCLMTLEVCKKIAEGI